MIKAAIVAGTSELTGNSFLEILFNKSGYDKVLIFTSKGIGFKR